MFNLRRIGMTKKWKFYDIDQEKANRIKNKLKISELLSEI